MTDPVIRPSMAADISAIERIVDATGLFPPDMVGTLLEVFLEGETQVLWHSAWIDGAVAGFCYSVPEMLTEGAWNVTAIAVAPAQQGRGAGGALLSTIEEELRARTARVIFIDTSSTENFAATRAFYIRAGYEEEARLRDFWGDGADKVTFRKAL